MSNDLLMVRCTYCGDLFVVARYFPDNFFVTDAARNGFTQWIQKHIQERFEADWHIFGPDLECVPGFEFTTENKDTSTGQGYFYRDGKRYSFWSDK
jgi:hypothetical protein